MTTLLCRKRPLLASSKHLGLAVLLDDHHAGDRLLARVRAMTAVLTQAYMDTARFAKLILM